jgi:cysteine desulfurase/selenocysteine lyase
MKSVFDPYALRMDFPILSRTLNGKPLVYLDNAATSQKPEFVLKRLDDYYRTHNANVHRALHILSQEATRAFEEARATLSKFIGAPDPATCIFTKNATEGLNLVAHAWGKKNLTAGDEILITEMEHHSNIVPWQIIAAETGAEVRYVPITAEGALDLEAFEQLLTPATRIVSVIHVSNVLGTINPVADLSRRAHENGAIIVLDAAQSVPHMPVDVIDLDVDFMAISSHKMCGPTGAGLLWGRRDLLEEMEPFLGGGEMIEFVSKEGTTYNRIPYKFEAGTPNIAEAVGMAAAADYLMGIGLAEIHEYESGLVNYAMEQLDKLDGIRIFGPRQRRSALVSFGLEGVHPHDISTMLDENFIAVRAGHHCTQILHEALDVPSTTRASFAFYNTREEVDLLVESLQNIVKFFRR